MDLRCSSRCSGAFLRNCCRVIVSGDPDSWAILSKRPSYLRRDLVSNETGAPSRDDFRGVGPRAASAASTQQLVRTRREVSSTREAVLGLPFVSRARLRGGLVELRGDAAAGAHGAAAAAAHLREVAAAAGLGGARGCGLWSSREGVGDVRRCGGCLLARFCSCCSRGSFLRCPDGCRAARRGTRWPPSSSVFRFQRSITDHRRKMPGELGIWCSPQWVPGPFSEALLDLLWDLRGSL